MGVLTDYIKAMRRIRASEQAMPETSYYGCLERLLNAVGDGLKPARYVVPQVKSTGGVPDGGVFVEGQEGLRALIEVKAPDDDSWRTAEGTQVTKYWDEKPLVLVTNYRDFVVVGRDAHTGKSRIDETYSLVAGEDEFWQAGVRSLSRQEESFVAFLTQFLRQSAAVVDPMELAEQLGYYARLAREKVMGAPDEAVAGLRDAMQELLGIRFLDKEAEQLFFRSSLVQTLFYGLFSAWMIWAEDAAEDAVFDWRTAQYLLDTPVVEVLFGEVAKPHRVRDLRLKGVLDWAGAALNRVARDEFWRRFERDHAITYFYEPFLEAYDPVLRNKLGVWYTPPEIVHYQVQRVHQLLQSELGLPDGLADSRVVVLDPCAGTGSYLLEVARTILRAHRERGEGGQAIMLTRQALLDRVIGFEILTAPFVIAHLQLGRLLSAEGAALESHERLPIYLTNALTGWQETEAELQQRLAEIARIFPELSTELAEAEEVKRSKPVMVILGNPPYNAYYGVGEGEEAALVEPYKRGLNTPEAEGGWGIKKFNLDDLYVRFFRLAERQISEAGLVDRGVVSFISNYSWTKKDSFMVMREHILGGFQQIWLDSLNGDKFETGKRTPDGRSDQSIFTTESNPEGIQLGTAIATMVRLPYAGQRCSVRWRESWGLSANKRRWLVESLAAPNIEALYEEISPQRAFKYVLKPLQISDEYMTWPMVTELAQDPPMNGLMEKRGFALISIDPEPLERRMKAYYDPEVSDAEVAALHQGLLAPAARFDDPSAVRRKLQTASGYSTGRLRRYAFKPMDTRWAYIEPMRPLWNEPRPALLAQAWEGNRFLLTRPRAVRDPEGLATYASRVLGDNDLLTGHAYYIPFYTRLGQADAPLPNLSAAAKAYLSDLDFSQSDSDAVWMHVLSIASSPLYVRAEADGCREDWIRIPMPSNVAVLESGRALGERVAALLDPDAPVSGVTCGAVRAGLLRVGYLRAAYASEREREVTVSYRGTGRVLARQRTAEEWQGVDLEAQALGLSRAAVVALLGGEETYDVVWNTEVEPNPRWENVPVAAWEFCIGGYPVLKKWLSYRRVNDLGRALRHDELRLFRDLARRVTALILMGPELDAHYEASKACAVVWHEGETA